MADESSKGVVHRAHNIITGEVVAVKLEPIVRAAVSSALQHEHSVLAQLQGATGLPRPLWFGREGSHRVMVLENLGKSLDKLVCDSPLGVLERHYIAWLGLQMVHGLSEPQRQVYSD